MNATAFRSPLDLLAALERGIRLDALLLDILMPGQNGIETAAEIRQHDQAIKIIFLTSSSEFGVEAYAVNACQYLLKPIHAGQGFPFSRGNTILFCSRQVVLGCAGCHQGQGKWQETRSAGCNSMKF